MIKSTLIKASILLSVLATTPVFAQDLPASPPTHKVKEWVKIKKLCIVLTNILFDKKLDQNGLKDLLNCIKKEKVGELFGFKGHDFKRLFNVQELNSFFALFIEKSSHSNALLKANSLKKAFKSQAWKELLDDSQEEIISGVCDLLFFTGTAQEKKIIVERWISALETMSPPLTDNHFFYEIFNKELLKRYVADVFALKETSKDRLLSLFNIENLTKKQERRSSAGRFINLQNLLVFIFKLSSATALEDTRCMKELVQCMRWDALAMILLEESGLENSVNKIAFQSMVQHLQQGQAIAAGELKSLIKAERGIIEETVSSCIDFEKLARGLNSAREGILTEDLKNAINLQYISALTGVDFTPIFNMENSEAVQVSKFAQAYEYVNEVRSFQKDQAIPFFQGYCTAIAFWLTGRLFWPEVMEFFEPQSPFLIVPLLGATIFGMLKAKEYFKVDTTSPEKLAFAVTLTKIAHLGNKLFAKNSPTKEQLKKDIELHPLKALIEQFIDMITDEHLALLSDAAEVALLFENPVKFISTHESFIEALCTVDPEGVAQRIAFLKDLLAEVAPIADIPHCQSMLAFFSLLPDNISQMVPHTELLKLAIHSPKLLLKQLSFLEAASRVTSEHEGQTLPVISIYVKALREAQQYEANR